MEEAKRVKSGAKSRLTKLCTGMQAVLDCQTTTVFEFRGYIEEWDKREAKLEQSVEDLTRLTESDEDVADINDSHMDYIMLKKGFYYKCQDALSKMLAAATDTGVEGSKGGARNLEDNCSAISSVSQVLPFRAFSAPRKCSRCRR